MDDEAWYLLMDCETVGRHLRGFRLRKSKEEDPKTQDSSGWPYYLLYLSKASNSVLWEWLKNPVFSFEVTVQALNTRAFRTSRQAPRKSFPFKMKAYVCRHRPDLIGKIARLPRKLRRKYSRELELSRVDL